MALHRSGVDWSALPSGHTFDDVRLSALEIARRYLDELGDSQADDLSNATDRDLLRRLNVVDGKGILTNAGLLLFVGTPSDGIDYIRRDVPSGDSLIRVRSNRALIEQIRDVEQAIRSSNRLTHVRRGFVHLQLAALPPVAAREAIVNGVVHRDWLSPNPTTVEHVGDTLVVVSPGGFIGGISPANIITHPAVARYRSLAEAMATLGLAEREGVGADRMFRDMLILGLRQPEVSEVEGPYVRLGLIGGAPDPNMLDFIGRLEPESARRDLDVLLMINLLIDRGWIDVATAGPVIQRSSGETEAAVQRLLDVRIGDSSLVKPVGGVPDNHPPAYILVGSAAPELGDRIKHHQTPGGRRRAALEWASFRGRASSSEIAALTDCSVNQAGSILSSLEEEGLLEASRANKRGRGFFYLPVI